MKNRNIVILALHLGAGGAEKVICNVANILCKNNNVTIISTYKLSDKPAFEIDEKVKIEYLMTNLQPNKRQLKTALKHLHIIDFIKEAIHSMKILYLRKKLMIKKIKQIEADIIISTRILHNNWVGKYAKKRIIKIAQEHNYHNNNKKYIKKLIKSLKNIDYLMPTSKGLSNFYEGKIGKTKIKYIPNYVERKIDEVSELKNKVIISVGRLEQVKGFPDLIDVFAIFQKDHPEWSLKIVGKGSQEELLRNKIRAMNLQDKVFLIGEKNTEELAEEYYNASLYVMTSYSESFGLVLLEAASFGLPLIAFDSAEGAKEIIQNGQNGYLIQNRNKEDMSNKIEEIIENREQMITLAKNAKNVLNVFSKENVEKEWKEFLESL